MKKSRFFIIMFIILALVVACSFIAWYVAKPAPLVLQGEAVAQSYKVSSKVPGRIDSLTLKVGDKIIKGDFVFALSTPEIDAKLQQAEALLSAAAAKNLTAKEGLRPQEIVAIHSMLEKAQAGLELAKVSYERVKNLYNDGVVPAQKLDEAKANYTAMENTVKAAQAQYNMALEGARQTDRMAAEALVRQAKGGVSEVKSYLKDAVQYAPASGEISSVVSEVGELVSSGYPVVTIVDTDDIWFSFNVKETLLPKIKEGLTFDVDCPAMGKKIKVKVSYISVEAQYATWSATRTSGQFDIRTFEVRARPVDSAVGLRPGMSVLVDWNEI